MKSRILSQWMAVRAAAAACLLLASAMMSRGAGVTVITHGARSNADGWVAAMASAVTNRSVFYGQEFALYELTLTRDLSGMYYYHWGPRTGPNPSQNNSAEIVVRLDWGDMAGILNPFDTHSTHDVAAAVSYVLGQPHVFPDLGGRALAELPIHLVGHSRGGSLMTQLSHLLGTNGIWVDHLTTLDPHPLNNDGNINPLLPIDASARPAYANVLFRDNYWQDVPWGLGDVNGQEVLGAFNRYLPEAGLQGGYSSSPLAPVFHSNVHLWYHGTIDLSAAVSDSEAILGPSERATWYVPQEYSGANAGFVYSRLGRGDRTARFSPLGFGQSQVRDGFNQRWDLGAGQLVDNRTNLASNSGDWPNLIRLVRNQTNAIVQGQSASFRLYWQWAKPPSSVGTIQFYLDEDLNPLNFNQRLLSEMGFQGTGAGSINWTDKSLPVAASNTVPDYYGVFAKITGGGRTRYLYAPELVQVIRDPSTCVFSISPGSIPVTRGGITNSFNVTATSGCAWTAVPSHAWIRTTSSGMGNGTVAFSVDANPGSTSRTGTITVEGQVFAVTQAGAFCLFTFLPVSLGSLPAAGGTTNFTVNTSPGCGWTAASEAGWIQTTSTGAGTGTVTLALAPNPTAYSRLGNVTVGGWSMLVSQAGATCTPALTPSAAAHGPDPATYSFDLAIPEGCFWTATAAAAWIQLSGATFGNGPAVVKYDLAANATTAARTGTIVVAGQTFTITQAAGWVPHSAFGMLWDSGDGWRGSSAYGWMWFHPGGQWIWSSALQGWLAVTQPGSRTVWSTQFRWLTPSATDPHQAETTAIGMIYVGRFNGSSISEGWVYSPRFAYVWAAGDGTWFYSNSHGWLGVSSAGGIWSVNEGRFL
jgi:hypothetical protein